MIKICIVIPCYNEENRLNITMFSDFLKAHQETIDLLFVNDGSSDNTLKILEQLKNANTNNCNFLNLDVNSGKAEAVRQGINKAYSTSKYDYIAYFDADLATPLSEILLLTDIVEHNPKIIMVLCSRVKRLGANIKRKLKRHLLGRVFATFASQILNLAVYDTQCGAKLIKASLVPQLFNTPFITSWLFDIEIIARIRNMNPLVIESVLYEHPVTAWEDIGGSKLKLKHMIKVPWELFKISRKYNK